MKNRVNRVLAFADLRKKVPPTATGEPIVDTYKLTYNDDGSVEIVVAGKRNIVAEIQSHADSVDLHKILEQCKVTGDVSPLFKTEGFYGDLVGFPTNYAEAIQKLAEANHIWDQLPTETKEKFDNDVNQFFATAFSDSWIQKIGMIKEAVEEDDPKESEVKDE